MSIDSTRRVMQQYWDGHSDTSVMADDVVFTVMGTGQEYRGPEAVDEMLRYFYHIAFDARADTTNTIFSDNQAVLEADFTGKQLAEFGGIPATGKEVHIPLCVIYSLEN